jgi:hypothetical protein
MEKKIVLFVNIKKAYGFEDLERERMEHAVFAAFRMLRDQPFVPMQVFALSPLRSNAALHDPCAG